MEMNNDLVIFEQRVIQLLNTRIKNDTKDFGTVVDYYRIDERFILIMDSGKKIDAYSALRFLSAYRRKDSAIKVVYPDGTKFAARLRNQRVRTHNHAVDYHVVNNVAKVGDESISITSHTSSSDVFDEEYAQDYESKIEVAKQEMGL